MLHDNELFSAENVAKLDELEKALYGHFGRWREQWKKYILFTDTGATRLASIAGYLLGLKHAGHEELAIRMVVDLHRRFEQLGFKAPDVEFEFQCDGQTERVSVPPRKTILGDDGCLHSFGFMTYYPVPPAKYQERWAHHQDEIERIRATGVKEIEQLTAEFEGATPERRAELNEKIRTKTRKLDQMYDTAHDRVVKELSICERVDYSAPYSDELTEHRFVGHQMRKIYYCRGYNGGLIFHGPGSGETFSVVIGGDREILWSIHT